MFPLRRESRWTGCSRASVPELTPWTFAFAVLCGGLVGMDAVSWPQAMISRPLVAGTLGGALLGHPGPGLLVGAILEILSLRHPPFGAARYPDTGPAAIVAGAAYAASAGSVTALAASVGAGWVLGWVGARTVYLLRGVNGWLLRAEARLDTAPLRLERRQRLSVGMDFGRGALLTAGLLVPTVLGVRVVPPGSGGWRDLTAGVALSLVLGGAAGASAGGLFGRRRGWLLLAVGGIVSALVVVLA